MAATTLGTGGTGADGTDTAPGSRPTVAQVAREAGVSAPTASKVLNARPGVAPATRERVLEILRSHGYTARRATRRAGVVELLLKELDSPWSTSMVRAMESAAHAEGLQLMLSCVRTDEESSWLDDVAENRPDGLVFAVVEVTEGERSQLADLGIPFVVIDPEGNQPLDVPAIGLTHWRGAYEATRYLAELGHTRIATIGGPLRVLCSRARTDGFRAAAAAAGLTVPAEHVVHAEFSHAQGLEVATRLLAGTPRPTAIFAGSDEQALGVYEAARLAGLRIPDDLSVVGFNDAPIAAWASPPLTTVREPIDDMARQALTLLQGLGAGRRPPAAIEMATELVVRESTAPPR